MIDGTIGGVPARELAAAYGTPLAVIDTGEVELQRFIEKCQELERRGVRFSVGVGGLKENAEPIAALRRERLIAEHVRHEFSEDVGDLDDAGTGDQAPVGPGVPGPDRLVVGVEQEAEARVEDLVAGE